MPGRPPKRDHRKPPFKKAKPHGGFRKRRPAPAGVPRGEGEPPHGDRLQKVLAAAGIGSRRECEQLIVEGRVQVDGQIVSELGARVDRQQQEIRVDGEPLARPRLQYFAVNKPTGVVSTARDPAGRPRVNDLLPPGVGRMFNVGRLDLASDGLILVTNDGELANQLTHPRHGVRKVYEVQVAGQPEPDVLAQLKRGVHLSEGFAHAVDVRVKGRKKGSTLLEMVLDEGRNREVRRLLARVGHKVQRLTRVAVGPIRLGELPRGAVRQLTPEEVRKLRAAAVAGRMGDGSSERVEAGVGTATQRPMKPRKRASENRPNARTEHGGKFRKKKPAAGEFSAGRRIIGDGASEQNTPAEAGEGKPKRPGGPRFKKPARGFTGRPKKRPGGPKGKGR
jgi:23S rRNA pseudouridine2605 synthase